MVIHNLCVFIVDSCSVEVSIMLSIFYIDKYRFHVWVTRSDMVTLVCNIILWHVTRDTHHTAAGYTPSAPWAVLDTRPGPHTACVTRHVTHVTRDTHDTRDT